MDLNELSTGDRLVCEAVGRGFKSKDSSVNTAKNSVVEKAWGIGRYRIELRFTGTADASELGHHEWKKTFQHIDAIVDIISKECAARASEIVLAKLQQLQLPLQDTENKSTNKKQYAEAEKAWHNNQWIAQTDAQLLLGVTLSELQTLAKSGKCMMRLSDANVPQYIKTDSQEIHEALFHEQVSAGFAVPLSLFGLYVSPKVRDICEFERYLRKTKAKWEHVAKINRLHFVKAVKS
jgi:hypothetical protein